MKDIPVVGAILMKDGKILCAQRGNSKTLPYLWEFPGGKIEPGETAEQALQRELQEELLIDVDIHPTAFDKTVHEYDFGRVHLATYLCQLKSGQPTLTEHVDVKWLLPSQLHTLEWAPADIPTVEKLMEEGG